jgi:hypothetical protein
MVSRRQRTASAAGIKGRFNLDFQTHGSLKAFDTLPAALVLGSRFGLTLVLPVMDFGAWFEKSAPAGEML